jgi:hypothetical protein
MVKWAEISLEPQTWRYELLMQELRESGFENEFHAITAPADAQSAVLLQAEKDFALLRLGTDWAMSSAHVTEKIPALMLTLKSADTMVYSEGGWWPRNFLFEAIQQITAQDIQELDLLGSVFLVGAGPEARAVIGALVKVGFKHFNITDPDEAAAQALVEDLKVSYFSARFQTTSKNHVTQLPGVYSVGVNTLSIIKHPELLNELYYFNFLKTQGVWLEMQPIPLVSPLMSEAKAVGAQVLTGVHLLVVLDAIWTRSCFAVEIDRKRYESKLTAHIESLKIEIEFSPQQND